ncbi:MAG: transketolase family protein [Bacteroidota bacterium]
MADKVATRDAYGKALVELGKRNPNVVVLDADLSKSTKTAGFAKEFPGRFIQMGIAEADMAATAAGLATCGKIPFFSSFAVFASGRCFEQIRNSIGYPHLNVKIAATHAGITVGEDGGSHQAIEDLALMRSIPGMTVIAPADAADAEAAVYAAAEYEGPVYLRFGREPMPVIFPPDRKFIIGKADRLREGRDVAIIANGVMTPIALQAAEQLAAAGKQVRVINISTLKPIDEAEITAAAKETGAIVTAEEHTVIGGLGSAVAEVVVKHHPVPMECLGLQDRFGQSGSPAALMREYGLTVEDIVKAVEKVLARKK